MSELKSISRTPVTAIMSRQVQTLSMDDSLALAARLMLENGFGSLPITNAQGRCVGMLSRADLTEVFLQEDQQLAKFLDSENASPVQLMSLVDTCEEKRVRELMSYDVVSLSEQDNLSTACRQMIQHQIHHLPVLDPSGGLVGVVSTLDIIRYLARQS